MLDFSEVLRGDGFFLEVEERLGNNQEWEKQTIHYSPVQEPLRSSLIHAMQGWSMDNFLTRIVYLKWLHLTLLGNQAIKLNL